MARKKRRRSPFTIEIEWPDGPLTRPRAGLLIASGLALFIAVAVGGWALWRFKLDRPTAADAVVHIASQPSGVAFVDGRKQSATPIDVALPKGAHQVTVARDGYMSRSTAVELQPQERASVDLRLWLNEPPLQPLRPPFPGGSLSDANFAGSDEIALTVALPDGRRQLWLNDGIEPARQVGPTASRLALSPDGRLIAYLAPPADGTSSPGASAPDVLWAGNVDGRTRIRYAPADLGTDRNLSDLIWATNSQEIVLAIQVRSGGHHWTELLLIEANGSGRQLVRFPSDVVPGSFSWNPAGDELAFLARSESGTSLCIVGVPRGELHYLADLKPPDGGDPLPVPPIGWSAAGQRAYSAIAPGGGDGGWLLGAAGSTSGVFLMPLRGPGRQIGPSSTQFPAWLDDGTLLTVQRSASDKPLTVQALNVRTGHSQPVGQLTAPSGTDYAVRWDVPHGRAILAVHHSATSGAGVDFGWVDFVAERPR